MAVDLDGTNCRFARFTLDKGILSLHHMDRRKTAELPDTGALISACGTALDRHPHTADAFVVGMADPVADPLKARLTNAPLEVDLTDAGERYGIRLCRTINDFTAEACACLTEAGSGAYCVLDTPGPRPAGPIGIIGAGTGLGTASLIRDSHGSWLPPPAEGGHVIFPFIGKEEAASQDFAARELELVCLSGDDVLSGRGLRLLYLFLTGERRGAHEIVVEAFGSEAGTLRRYARFYARACRNWALSTLCTGGLSIIGSIALRNPLVAECAAFREAFYEGPHRKLLERILVRRFTSMNSGLWGSAWFGIRMTA